jgi:hypothetical protein
MGHLSHRVDWAGGHDRHVIELPREFEGEAVAHFRRLATEILLQPGTRIHVACRRVKRCTDEGIAVLVAAHARARRMGCRFVLDAPRQLLGSLPLGSLGDDDDGQVGVPSPIIPPPSPMSGQAERALPKPDEEELH